MSNLVNDLIAVGAYFALIGVGVLLLQSFGKILDRLEETRDDGN